MGVRRTVLVSGCASIAAALGFVGVAFACTPLASMSVSRNAAPPDRNPLAMTVNGQEFERAPVEIRWNAVTGPLLATADGPTFSLTATAPADVVPGVYYVVAVQRDTDGSVKKRLSATMEIPGSSGTVSPAPRFPSAAQPGLDTATNETFADRWGVGLLSVGVVVLGAGGVAAGVSRSRAKARVTNG